MNGAVDGVETGAVPYGLRLDIGAVMEALGRQGGEKVGVFEVFVVCRLW